MYAFIRGVNASLESEDLGKNRYLRK